MDRRLTVASPHSALASHGKKDIAYLEKIQKRATELVYGREKVI